MRAVPEWIGSTPNTQPPPRVRVRVFDRCKGRCAMCERKLRSGDKWELDHVIALCLGGENRETNLAVACAWCHYGKTSIDVAIKSGIYKKRAKHIGIRRTSRPMIGSKRSGWKHRLDGTWERRT